ncbi:MAG: cyclopropane-fatty-acyl-phospholipid synthase [Pseudomonadota bacterium]|jgi:cyclopropane-fatty-acyl-phospholipid synthase
MTTGQTLSDNRYQAGGSGLFCKWLANRVSTFQTGSVSIELPDGSKVFHAGQLPGPEAAIRVLRWRFLWRLATEGEIGLGRCYVDGDWSSPDLGQVFAFGLANLDTVGATTGGWSFAHLLNAIWHGRNANTRSGSRRNIAAHYDLGNAFYAHWLDEQLNYSSGIYDGDRATLEEAQALKLDRIVELLDLHGGESVLEIGCGWGALARRLSRRGVADIRGITLSEEQLAHARSMQPNTATDAPCSFELLDYRDLNGTFDRVVSIEMFEAVGERYWQTYFDKLRSCLTEDGVAVMQIITIDEAVFESYRNRPDFIQQYIFPGGMLPTVEIVESKARLSGLRLLEHQRFGQSYARTLSDWHDRFQTAWPEIRALGFDDRFRRMWEYYLKYCEKGFRDRQLDVGLFKFSPE